MKKIILLIIFILSINQINAQIDTNQYIDSISKNIDFVILNHNYYKNYFSVSNKLSLFVIYSLDSTKIKNNNYSAIFVKDPLINLSLVKYYKNTNYDRGHLFNAEDASSSKSSFLSSYYITNATPQVPEFNRGIWKVLEKKIRDEAKKDKLIIITGCDLYGENLKKLSNVISIPNYFFKVIINLTQNKTSIYYIPNKYSNNKLSDFLINDKLFQNYTGIYLSGKY
jgi:endonuclease G